MIYRFNLLTILLTKLWASSIITTLFENGFSSMFTQFIQIGRLSYTIIINKFIFIFYHFI